MTKVAAAASPNANAILQAIGPLNFDDDGPAQPPCPDVVTCDLSTGQLLLLCSDGLWKYAPGADELADVVRRQPPRSATLELSRSLVEYANARGGSDNVTAAILHRAQEVP
jgi:serine/threonine protein phosphatase PrpC